MGVLRKLWGWWRALWDLDYSCGSMEVDSHLWDNKTEILRRLSRGNC